MVDQAWNEDINLKDEMEKYVRQGLMHEEALDFLKRDFPQYAWSVRSLDRRMRYFHIYYNDRTVSVEEDKEAVKKELEGPGKLLGYRAMHKKVRQEHNLLITRDTHMMSHFRTHYSLLSEICIFYLCF